MKSFKILTIYIQAIKRYQYSCIVMIPFSENLHYLDPGTGSYLFQALLAAGITVGIYFKNLKFFILSVLKKVRKSSKD